VFVSFCQITRFCIVVGVSILWVGLCDCCRECLCGQSLGERYKRIAAWHFPLHKTKARATNKSNSEILIDERG